MLTVNTLVLLRASTVGTSSDERRAARADVLVEDGAERPGNPLVPPASVSAVAQFVPVVLSGWWPYLAPCPEATSPSGGEVQSSARSLR
jgi:hypothetical protein